MLHCVSRPVVGAVGTHINGAAQQRASLQGFGNDAVQVFGSFTQLVHLGHSTCEVFKTFGGGTSRQSFIWAMQPTGKYTRYGLYYCRIEEEEEDRGRDSLGVGLFQKSTPELISFCWVNKHQLFILDRQAVVNYDVHPLAKLPELHNKQTTYMKILKKKKTIYILINIINY